MEAFRETESAKQGTGERARQLKTFAALADGPSLVHTHLRLQYQEVKRPLVGSMSTKHICDVHTCMQAK